MTKEERITMLDEARELISEALGMIRYATKEDTYVEAYLCAPLSLFIDEGMYVSHDITITWVIERISEDGVNEEEDDDDNMADIDDERGRGYVGRAGRDEDDQCGGCGSALNTTPPCPACGERICQDCASHHVCDPE